MSMSCDFFSTRNPLPVLCAEPVLTVSFPVAPVAANTITLVNGAVVDLEELGRIIAQTCPGFVCD